MKPFLAFVLVCCFVSGCSDEGVRLPLKAQDILEIIDTEAVVSAPPDHVFEVAMGKHRDEWMEWTRGYWGLEADSPGYFGTSEELAELQVEIARKLDGVALEDFDLEALQREFYTNYIDADGIAIVAPAQVRDIDLIEARRLVLTMTQKHPAPRDRFSWEHGFYLVLLAPQTAFWDVPTLFSNGVLPGCSMKGFSKPGVFGFCFAPLLIPYRVDPLTQAVEYVGQESPHQTMAHLQTFAHEFGHAIDFAVQSLDPTFDAELVSAYNTAHTSETWMGLYADTNPREYWAEGVEIWFYDIGKGREFESYEAFAERDPLLAELLDAWFPRIALPRHY